MFELDLTRVDYTWQPAGESQPNTFTAQNIFKSPSATVAGGVFQSSGTISAIPAGYGGSNIVAQFLAEESSAFPYTLFESTGNAVGHILALRSSRGTYSARTATQSGDVLGQLDFGGHNSSALVNGKGSIRAVAAQTWTAGANGTNLLFFATANGSTTSSQILQLTSSTMSVNGTIVGNALLTIYSNAGQTKILRFTDQNLTNRWQILSNATAETGLNVGSDFEIRRYSDAGADLGVPFGINRATGVAIFGDAIVNTETRIDRAAGTNRMLLYRTAGLNRWAVYTGSGAETGTGNAGSDFGIERYNDAGSFLGLVMLVTRSNGNITFNGGGGTTTFSANQIRITTTQTPASATATGTAGTICWDANYIYVCTATDTWKRVAIATWP